MSGYVYIVKLDPEQDYPVKIGISKARSDLSLSEDRGLDVRLKTYRTVYPSASMVYRSKRLTNYREIERALKVYFKNWRKRMSHSGNFSEVFFLSVQLVISVVKNCVKNNIKVERMDKIFGKWLTVNLSGRLGDCVFLKNGERIQMVHRRRDNRYVITSAETIIRCNKDRALMDADRIRSSTKKAPRNKNRSPKNELSSGRDTISTKIESARDDAFFYKRDMTYPFVVDFLIKRFMKNDLESFHEPGIQQMLLNYKVGNTIISKTYDWRYEALQRLERCGTLEPIPMDLYILLESQEFVVYDCGRRKLVNGIDSHKHATGCDKWLLVSDNLGDLCFTVAQISSILTQSIEIFWGNSLLKKLISKWTV